MEASDRVPQTTDAQTEVRRMLGEGRSREALKAARKLHRAGPTPESSALFADACFARVDALLARDLVPEARSLLGGLWNVIRPDDSDRGRRALRLGALLGDVRSLVAPLADPDLSPERRGEIEDAVGQLVADPAALAGCDALPPDHPLRLQAAAIATALAAVTSAPVADHAFALEEVPHRSPLAPWKLLVRAVALAYRGDEAACEACLSRLAPGPAPAILVPVVRAVLDEATHRHATNRHATNRHAASQATPPEAPPEAPPRSPAAMALLGKIRSDPRPLRDALTRLDHAIASDDLRELRLRAREALVGCARSRPDLEEELRQRISLLGLAHGWSPAAMRAAIGKPPLRNARFWLLYARTLEGVSHPFHACAAWTEFGHHARSEGWLKAGGPQAGALALHMATIASRVRADEDDEARDAADAFEGFGSYYRDQPKAIRAVHRDAPRDLSWASPAELFRRAAAILPRSDAFPRWLDWASDRGRTSALAREAAEAWHAAVPDDARPLIHLVEAAERRGALKKAMTYLDLAEAIDALNPRVRSARFRLVVASTMRHLGQRNLRLVAGDLAALEALAQTAERDRPALVAALRAVAAHLAGDASGLDTARDELAARLGAEPAANLLIDAITTKARVPAVPGRTATRDVERSGEAISRPVARSVARAVARAGLAARDGGLRVRMDRALEQRVIAEMEASPTAIEPIDLAHLAEAALEADCEELACAAAGAGLRRSSRSPLQARLLLLRARSLPLYAQDRVAACLSAALAIARRERDEGTAREARAIWREVMGPLDEPDGLGRSPLDDAAIETVVASECRKGSGRLSRDVLPEVEVRTVKPERRRRAVSPPLPLFDFAPDDSPDDLDVFGDDDPPEVDGVLAEVIARYGHLPSPDELYRLDPALARRVEEALTAMLGTLAGVGPGVGSGVGPGGGRGARKRKRRVPKGRKRRNRR